MYIVWQMRQKRACSGLQGHRLRGRHSAYDVGNARKRNAAQLTGCQLKGIRFRLMPFYLGGVPNAVSAEVQAEASCGFRASPVFENQRGRPCRRREAAGASNRRP